MNYLIAVVENNMLLAYASIAIIGLWFLESMAKTLRYVTIAIIAVIMCIIANPTIPLPGWIVNALP